MKELTAFDVFNLVNESRFLMGGKIDNVYQTDEKDIYLQIYIRDKPKQLLRIIAGKAFFLTSNRPKFPENLMRFCAYLRKCLINSKIKNIEQIDYERIVRIELETKEGNLELFTELFGKGNIVLAKDKRILAVAEEQIWADRKLKPGEIYNFPKKSDIKDIFMKQKQNGTIITMEQLDKEFSKLTESKALSSKEKEINKIRLIIEKQSQQLDKIIKEAGENKKKGELIYENHQKLKKIMEDAKNSKTKSANNKIMVDL